MGKSEIQKATSYDEEKAGRVGAWLTGVLAAHPDVVHVQLSQRTLTANGQQAFAPVFQWKRSEGAPMEIAKAVLAAATVDASDTGGTCRYTVTAETAAGVIKQRTDVRIDGSKASGDVSPEDPPTAAGLVSQAMRHQELSAKLTLESVGMVFGLMEKMMAKQDQTLERYQAREERVMEMAERLAGADHERTLAIKRADNVQEMRTKAIEKLGPLVPAVMAKILKLPAADVAMMAAGISAAAKPAALGAGAPASASAAGTVMPAVSQSIGTEGGPASDEADAFLLSFEQSQLPAIAAAMNPEQRQRLVHLYKGAFERKEKREMAAAAPSSPTPAATEATT